MRRLRLRPCGDIHDAVLKQPELNVSSPWAKPADTRLIKITGTTVTMARQALSRGSRAGGGSGGGSDDG